MPTEPIGPNRFEQPKHRHRPTMELRGMVAQVLLELTRQAIQLGECSAANLEAHPADEHVDPNDGSRGSQPGLGSIENRLDLIVIYQLVGRQGPNE